MSLKEKLKKGEFAVTVELGPPKGTNVAKALEKAELLRKKSDAVNVTDNQRSVLHLGSLGLSKLLLDKGIEPVLQVTCRDRNRIALQSDLLNAHVLGIRNVLALSGDHPKFGDHPEAKPVYDVDSIQLIDIISGMNKGKAASGLELDGKTDFFIGAALNPCSDHIELELERMKKKVQNGCQFFQTQAVYDIELYKKFIKASKGIKAKILVGIVPLKSARMAKFMNDKVPGITVPDKMISELEESDNPKQTGIEQAAELIKQLKKIADGVHIMAIGNEEIVPEIIEKAGL